MNIEEVKEINKARIRICKAMESFLCALAGLALSFISYAIIADSASIIQARVLLIPLAISIAMMVYGLFKGFQLWRIT